jgi:hypothetical protein
MLAGWLLTPDWVFGEVFGLRPVLHDLWILVSNMVYVVFAFLLVVMAFMNIFAGEKNTWAIKAKLPKLIVGVISVPFTWFFVSGIVSISSVLTASAIQMAWDLKPTGPEINITMPAKCTLDFESAPIGWTNKSDGKFSSCDPATERPLSELLKSKDAYGIVSYYAYGVFQIQDLKKITEGSLWTVKSVLDLSVGVLIAVMVFIILFLIIAALVVALLSRAFYFWAIAIFSPLLSLRYFFDGKLWGFWDKWLTIGNVIGLAMVPVYVATALSLGLVFISAAQSTNFSVGKSDYYQIKKGEGQNDQIITVLGTEFTIKWKPVGTQVAKDALTLGGGTIGSLLIQVAALCILWFAVMTALKWSEITKEAAEPISQFGNEIGGLLKKLPQYAPIIPTGHGKASLSNLSSLWSGIKGAVTTRWNSEANEAGAKLAASMGFAGDKITTAMTQAASRFNPTTLDKGAAGSSIDSITKASGAKTVDEFVRMTAASKNIIASHIENLSEATLSKPKREEIAKLLRTGNAAEVTRAYAELDDELRWSIWGSGKDVQNNQFSVNAYMTGLQNSSAMNSGASAVTPKLTIMVDANNTKNLDIQVAAWEMSNFGTQATQATFADIKTALARKTPTEISALAANVKTQLSTAW